MPVSDWRPPDPSTWPSWDGCRRVAIDCETCDESLRELGPGYRRGGYVVGFSVGTDRGDRIYLPLRHGGGDNVADPERAWAYLRHESDRFTGELVGAYLVYDLGWFALHGITFPRVHRFRDVIVAAALCDEWRFNFSLDALSKDLLGEGKDQPLLFAAGAACGWRTADDVKRHLHELPARFAGLYGESDVDRPLRLLPIFERQIIVEGLDEVWDVESRLIPVILAMQTRGIRFDRPRAEEIYRMLSAERDALEAEARRIGGSRIKLTESDSFVPALRERGFDIPKTKPTRTFPEGRDSITKEWLVAHAGDELVDPIAAGRKLNTVLSLTFDSAFRHETIGRIHPTIHQLRGSKEDTTGDDDERGGAGTPARTSTANPNIQQIPARDKRLGPLCRSIYVPEEGEDWVSNDMGQIQFRLLVNCAVGAGAEEARQEYIRNPHTDFHKLAGDLLGADASDEFIRKRVKNTNFARVFLAGPKRLAITFGCSLEEAEAFNKRYDARLPFVGETGRRAAAWGAKRGFIVTVLNRRQRFPFWEPRRGFGRALPYERAVAEYGVGNVRRAKTKDALCYKLQGSEADIMKKAMVLAHEGGVTAPDALGPFLNIVHDELNLSRPKTRTGLEASQELRRIMETCVELRVPLLVGEKVGANWGSCH